MKSRRRQYCNVNYFCEFVEGEETTLFNTKDNKIKSFSDNNFISFTTDWKSDGFLIDGSKNSAGDNLKYSHISKNAAIDGSVRPDVIDCI